MEQLQALQEQTDSPVSVSWRSFELRPKDAPPPPPDYLAKVQANRPRLYAMAREHYDIEMNPGPFGFDSRPALTGAKYAEAAGHGPAYHKRVMFAYWEEARDIGDREKLADIAAEVGLDRAAFLSALDDETYVAQVMQDVASARAYGLNAVPAMVFAGQYLVSGAQPLAVLQQVIEQIHDPAAGQDGP